MVKEQTGGNLFSDISIWFQKEGNLCNVLPVKVKKLDLEDQCGVSWNLEGTTKVLHWIDKMWLGKNLWGGASTAVAIVGLDEEGGHLPNLHCWHS